MATKLTSRNILKAHLELIILPVRDVQHLAEALGVANHLVHQLPAFVVVGGADDKLFNLGEKEQN